MAKATNLRLFMKNDITYSFVIFNAAETSIEDVTSWAVSWMLKTDPNIDDADASITKTLSDGISITGAWAPASTSNTQRVEVAIEASDTEDLIPGNYYWELKHTDAGAETVLAFGILTLVKSVHS